MPASTRWGKSPIFSPMKDYLPYRILRGLNALTPRDITVKAVEIVDDSFDARRDGRSRLYEYLDSQPRNAVAVPPQSRLAYP